MFTISISLCPLLLSPVSPGLPEVIRLLECLLLHRNSGVTDPEVGFVRQENRPFTTTTMSLILYCISMYLSLRILLYFRQSTFCRPTSSFSYLNLGVPESLMMDTLGPILWIREILFIYKTLIHLIYFKSMVWDKFSPCRDTSYFGETLGSFSLTDNSFRNNN